MATPKNIVTTIERITPARAEELLANNSNNRHLRKSKVSTYALQMQAGFWRADSNDAILVAEDGELLNGQHRLHAVVEAGIPVNMAIRYGASKDIYPVLDQGLARTTADFLDVPNKNVVTGAARSMAAVKHGARLASALQGKMTGGSATVPNEWVFAEVDENSEEYQQAVMYARRFRNAVGKCRIAIVTFSIVFSKYLDPSSEITEFLDDVCSKRPESDASVVLKETLLRRNAKNVFTGAKDLTAIILYAYEKYQTGSEATIIKAPAALKTFDLYDRLARNKYEKKAGL